MSKRDLLSKRNIGLATAGAALALAFGSTAFAQSQSTQAQRNEPVLGFRATGEALRFRVWTGGCTSAEDFNLAVERSSGEAKVTLTRVVPDNCKGDFPEGTEIAFSYESAGVGRADAVRVMNRVAPQSR